MFRNNSSYISDEVGLVVRPVKGLNRFAKITLDRFEETDLSFEFTPKDFYYYQKSIEFSFEPGKFKVFVGQNSSLLF